MSTFWLEDVPLPVQVDFYELVGFSQVHLRLQTHYASS